jgi:exopolysaccharide biosynthesis polyprenyl glycosylphosphotransferase
VLRDRALLFHKLLKVADTVSGGLLFAALLTVPHLRDAAIGANSVPSLVAVGLVAALIWPISFDQAGLYASQRRTSLFRYLLQFAGATVVATTIIAGTVVLSSAPLVPLFALTLGATQLCVLGTIRTAAYLGLRLLRRSGRNYRNVLVVGSGPMALQARAQLENHPEWGQRIVGFLDESGEPLVAGIEPGEVHKLHDLPELLREKVIDEVIVACPRALLGSLVPVVSVCAAAGVPLTVLSNFFGDYLPPPRATSFGSLAALNFATVHHSRTQLTVKRAIDIAVSSLLLLISAPAVAIAALAIKYSSKGPVLFRQVRCGLNGHRFEMLKLRTMVIDAEARRAELLEFNEMDGPVFKVKNDPRITAAGRLLRRWSIDEVPQLWNVLKGDMSLVGPRPPIPSEVHEYETSDRRRLSMRPGLTCLWQVGGRNAIGFAQWVKLDLQYIDTWSLSEDFKILLKTLPAVMRGTGH